MATRILAIAGSLRAASLNRALVRAATELAPSGMAVQLFDGLGDIPLADEPTHQQIRKLLDAFAAWSERVGAR
jgi:NAD(P)H-dependent FMN reductase